MSDPDRQGSGGARPAETVNGTGPRRPGDAWANGAGRRRPSDAWPAEPGPAEPGPAEPGPAEPGAGEPGPGEGRRRSLSRITADPESVEKGLVTLVLTLVELLRQLMERQALRRVDQGDLTDDQVERVGSTLMALEERMTELREHFGLRPEDLNIDLGPLGPLLPGD